MRALPAGKGTMLNKRANARYLKTLSPYDKVLPHAMPKRSDAQVFYQDDIDCKYLDEYIAEKKAQGIEITYLDIFVAAAVPPDLAATAFTCTY